MDATNAPRKILVIKLGALGDFIQALGAMKAIRQHHKSAEIILLTTKPFEGFAKRSNYFNDIWLDKKPKTFDFAGWLALRGKLTDANFDRVYDLQNNDRTSIYLRLFPRKKRPEWVGAAKGASHRNDAPERTIGHALDGHKQTLALAGIENVEVDPMEWIKEDLSAFDLKKPFVLFVPGSAPQHPQKRWPAENYAALGNKLVERDIQPVLLGTQAEAETTSEIKTACPTALDLTGKTNLFQIPALAHEAHGAIGNDTGPMHMIAATGCPALALYSSHSNPVKHGIKGKKTAAIQVEVLSDLNVETVYKKFMETID